jgi:hypothetical protein
MNVRLSDADTQVDFSLNRDEELPIPFSLYLRPELKFQIKYPSEHAFS